MVKSRRKAREAALRALYQMEIAKLSARDAGLDMMAHSELDAELQQYADGLVKSYAIHKKEIDERLSGLMRDWDYARIAAIDRNLLRVAATELLFELDVPPAVTIDEAVEIAKKYGAAESPRFINGVLGSLLKDSSKASWQPKPNEAQESTPEPDPEPEVEEIEATQADELLKGSLWKIRSE